MTLQIGKKAYVYANRVLSTPVKNNSARNAKAHWYGRLVLYFSKNGTELNGTINTGKNRYQILKALSGKLDSEGTRVNYLKNKNYYYKTHFRPLEAAGLLSVNEDGLVSLLTPFSLQKPASVVAESQTWLPVKTWQIFQKMNLLFASDAELALLVNYGLQLTKLFLLHFKGYNEDKSDFICDKLCLKANLEIQNLKPSRPEVEMEFSDQMDSAEKLWKNLVSETRLAADIHQKAKQN